mmetsp:Transcript_10822/g.16302  ORF Transcript_10822/g.16302 Transcript_10822/m.16302 type:complete len:284 (+) Transcript_10822:453-1304(+)
MRKLNAVWKIYERNVDPEYLTKIVSKTKPPKASTTHTAVEGTSSTWQKFSYFQSIQIPLPIQRVDKVISGTTLIAHPLVQGPLRRSCILILEHSATNGSYGIAVNKPSEHSLGSAVKNLPSELDVFANNPVSFGGMIRRLQCIHDVPSFGGSKIPNCWKKQLYFGANLPRMRPQMDKLGTRLTSHCNFYVGCTLWGPGELEQQIQRGIWLAVSTPLDELLATQHDYLQQKLKMQQQKAADDNTETNPRELWSVLIDNIGEDFKCFNDVPRILTKSNVESFDWK